MAITKFYDVCCNICEKQFKANLGGLGVESLEMAERAGWLLIAFGHTDAAICPDCWRKIARAFQDVKTEDEG